MKLQVTINAPLERDQEESRRDEIAIANEVFSGPMESLSLTFDYMQDCNVDMLLNKASKLRHT